MVLLIHWTLVNSIYKMLGKQKRQFTCDSFQIHKPQLQEHKKNLLGYSAYIRGKLQHATEEPLLLGSSGEKIHFSYPVAESGAASHNHKSTQQNTFQEALGKYMQLYIAQLIYSLYFLTFFFS